MSLYDQAKADIAQITSNSAEWGTDITIEDRAGNTCVIKGIWSKHHLGVDTEGNRVNTRNAHVSFHENQTIAQGWNIRNSETEVNIIGYKMYLVDSTGELKSYVIKQSFPNETTGLIVCILGQYE